MEGEMELKKMSIAFGTLAVAGVVLASCGTDDETTEPVDPPVQEIEPTQDDASQAKEMERPPKVNEFNEETDDLDEAFHSEYASIKDFVISSVTGLEEGSDYRNRFAHAEQFIAEATITYTGYFHEEIEELGMTEDFEELKTAAAELVGKFGPSGEHLEGYDTKYTEFENKMKDVAAKL